MTRKRLRFLLIQLVQMVFVIFVSVANAGVPDLHMRKTHLVLYPDSVNQEIPRKKETGVHFYTGLTRWNKNIFLLDELIKEPESDLNLFGDDSNNDRETYGVLSDRPSFEILIDFSEPRIAGAPMAFGLGYERFHYSQSGFLDVEKILPGPFKDDYIGESIVMTHDLRSVYLFGTVAIEDYNYRHFCGYAIRLLGSLLYTNLTENEAVTMQTGLMQNNSTGTWEYKKESFSRTVFADLYSMEAGVRLEWHASAYFSVIFPQVTYRRTLYREAIQSKTYTSRLDGDQLIMPERTNGLNSLFFMFGLGLHF